MVLYLRKNVRVIGVGCVQHEPGVIAMSEHIQCNVQFITVCFLSLKVCFLTSSGLESNLHFTELILLKITLITFYKHRSLIR